MRTQIQNPAWYFTLDDVSFRPVFRLQYTAITWASQAAGVAIHVPSHARGEPYKLVLPSVFQNYFTTNSNVHTYATRSRSNIHMNRHSTTYGQRCLKYKGAYLWNNLPERLKMQASVNELKVLLRQHLVNEQHWWLFLFIPFVLNYFYIYMCWCTTWRTCLLATCFIAMTHCLFSNVSNNSISIRTMITVRS